MAGSNSECLSGRTVSFSQSIQLNPIPPQVGVCFNCKLRLLGLQASTLPYLIHFGKDHNLGIRQLFAQLVWIEQDRDALLVLFELHQARSSLKLKTATTSMDSGGFSGHLEFFRRRHVSKTLLALSKPDLMENLLKLDEGLWSNRVRQWSSSSLLENVHSAKKPLWLIAYLLRDSETEP